MVKVCSALVFTPPLVVPSLSCATTVTVTEPFALAAGVKVSVPLAAIAGCTLNSALLVFVTVKATVCVASSVPPPAEMLVAKFAPSVYAPLSSFTEIE